MDSTGAGSYEHLVAKALSEALLKAGRVVPPIADLLPGGRLEGTDLTLLGLGSLDWLSLATTIEVLTGIAFEDAVLLDDRQRSVAGWSAHLREAGLK